MKQNRDNILKGSDDVPLFKIEKDKVVKLAYSSFGKEKQVQH